MSTLTKIFVIFTNKRIPADQVLSKKVYLFYSNEILKIGDIISTSNYKTPMQIIGIGQRVDRINIKKYVKLNILQIRKPNDDQITQSTCRSKIIETYTLIGDSDYTYKYKDTPCKPSNNGFELFGHHEIWSD